MDRDARDENHILRMTVLPFRLAARAWVDKEFRRDLLRSPQTYLLAHSAYFPRTYNYMIPADTASLKHYSIPYLSPNVAQKTEAELLKLLEAETGDTPDFDAWLPAPILAKALVDSNARANLISNGVSYLRSLGYIAPTDLSVIQHSETTFCMPLRYNYIGASHFDMAMNEIRGDAAVIASTKCCGSGTCS